MSLIPVTLWPQKNLRFPSVTSTKLLFIIF